MPSDAPISCEIKEIWSLLIVLGEANIIGGVYWEEFAVTDGCSPSNASVFPPPLMLVVASVVQFAMMGDDGAIASKVKVTFSPCGLTPESVT